MIDRAGVLAVFEFDVEGSVKAGGVGDVFQGFQKYLYEADTA